MSSTHSRSFPRQKPGPQHSSPSPPQSGNPPLVLPLLPLFPVLVADPVVLLEVLEAPPVPLLPVLEDVPLPVSALDEEPPPTDDPPVVDAAAVLEPPMPLVVGPAVNAPVVAPL